MKQSIIDHNKKVAKAWQEDESVKWERRLFYFVIVPSIAVVELYWFSYAIKVLLVTLKPWIF